MSNQCDSVEILDPKLGCTFQDSSVTKHVLHALIQGNHCWVLYSIFNTAFTMQDILIDLAELCDIGLIQDIRGLEEDGC